MGSAALAKERISRLSWPEWTRRIDIILSGAGLSRSELEFSFRAAHFAGLPAVAVAIQVIRESQQIEAMKVNG